MEAYNLQSRLIALVSTTYYQLTLCSSKHQLMDAGLTNEADVCADNWADPGDDREEERGEPENTHSSARIGGCWCNGRNKQKLTQSHNFILNKSPAEQVVKVTVVCL